MGRGVKRILYGIEDGLCYFSLFCLTLLPAAEVVLRTFFKTRIPDSSGILVHLLLVAGLVSGMITTRNAEHLSIALVQVFFSDKAKRPLLIITNCLSAFVVTIIAWSSVSFIKIGLLGRMIGFIPDKVFALVIPIGYGVIAIRFARRAPLTGKARILPFAAVLLGTFCALPVIAKAVWGFDLPVFLNTLSDTLSLLAYYIRIPAIFILILAALAGTPLFVVMGGLALFLIQASWGEIDVVPNQVYMALTQDSIIPIPLFTLVGFFLSESKAGDRLVQTFRSLFSWLPGGMIIAAVLICAFFTSFTGASGVTILALGGHTLCSPVGAYKISGKIFHRAPYFFGKHRAALSAQSPHHPGGSNHHDQYHAPVFRGNYSGAYPGCGAYCLWYHRFDKI